MSVEGLQVAEALIERHPEWSGPVCAVIRYLGGQTEYKTGTVDRFESQISAAVRFSRATVDRAFRALRDAGMPFASGGSRLRIWDFHALSTALEIPVKSRQGDAKSRQGDANSRQGDANSRQGDAHYRNGYRGGGAVPPQPDPAVAWRVPDHLRAEAGLT